MCPLKLLYSRRWMKVWLKVTSDYVIVLDIANRTIIRTRIYKRTLDLKVCSAVFPLVIIL